MKFYDKYYVWTNVNDCEDVNALIPEHGVYENENGDKCFSYQARGGFKEVVFDPYSMTQIVVYINKDECINLDEWNGKEFCTGGTGHHYYVYKLDKGTEKGKFLLVHDDCWDGSFTTCYILDRDEMEMYLEKLDRKEYIKELDNL